MQGTNVSKFGQFSIIPARALDDTRFDSNERYLRALLVLGTYADKNGWCFPGLKTVGERLGASKSTMSATFHTLASWGYIKIVRQAKDDGGFTSNKYRIIHDAELPKEFDRTLPCSETSVISEHPVQKPYMISEHPVQTSSVEIGTNVPINVPINIPPLAETPSTIQPDGELVTFESLKPALTNEESQAVDARISARTFENGGAGVGSPQAARQEFIGRIAKKIERLCGLAEGAETARQVAAKIYQSKTARNANGTLDRAFDELTKTWRAGDDPFYAPHKLIAIVERRKKERGVIAIG